MENHPTNQVHKQSFMSRWEDFWEGHSVLALLLVSSAVGWFFFIYVPSTAKWSGEGAVSLFPQGAESKNYRLKADIETSRKINGPISYTELYSIDRPYWPNGGWSTFDDCTVERGTTKECETKDGDIYKVEIASTPEPPDTSDEN